MTIQELEAIRLNWSLQNFPDATVDSSLLKAIDEIHEVFKAHRDHEPKENIKEEYADILMCVFDSFGRAGFSVNEIFEAFKVKLKKNQGRTWVKNADNTYSHVK